MDKAYSILYNGALIVIGVLLLFTLIRAIRGPRIADRIIAVNMMGTLVVITICVLAFLMNEGYLVDVGDRLHHAFLPGGRAADEGLHGRLPPETQGKGG